MEGRQGKYRGRLAPSPTGYLHVGHAYSFWIAHTRARHHGGELILRIEDLDPDRCKPEFTAAVGEDLKWFGLKWTEGGDLDGPHIPYVQSQRVDRYIEALDRLKDGGHVYPCTCSRRDILRALQAPNLGDDEPLYPGTCRPASGDARASVGNRRPDTVFNWRFRVLDGQAITFTDGFYGPQRFIAGTDFGDFIVWRHDDVPAYQLAVVVDDAEMGITEVVRGRDLMLSTARQLLLYQAMGLRPPAFFHSPLVVDTAGNRLAKRHNALSLRTLREQGVSPEKIRENWMGFSVA